MPKVSVGDIEIFYEEHGDGEPLLLIMGWGGNTASWKPQIPGLADQYRVLAFDNRGAGRTTAPEGPYSIHQMAADAVGLLDALDVPEAHVFGISMGGMIAQELAMEWPKRVQTLVLGCTTPGGERSAGYAELRQDIDTFHEETKDGGPDLEWLSEFLKRLWSDEAITKADGYLQDFVFSLIRFPAPPHGLRNQANAIAAHDVYDRLHSISQPTLVITGEEDGLIDPRNANLLADLIPNAELKIFPGLKHAFHLEQPDLVNEAIIEHIERSRTPLVGVARRARVARSARAARPGAKKSSARRSA